MPSPAQLYGHRLLAIVTRHVVAGGRHKHTEAHRVIRCLGLELKCQVLGHRGCRRMPPYWSQGCTVRAPGRDCDGATLNRGTPLYDRRRPMQGQGRLLQEDPDDAVRDPQIALHSHHVPMRPAYRWNLPLLADWPPEGLLTWKLYLQSDGRSGYSDVTTSAVARHWHPFCRARHVAGPRCDNIAQTRPFS